MGHDHGRKCVCVTDHRPRPDELHAHHVWPLGEGGPDIDVNLLWLCLAPWSRVLMADGTLRTIVDVRPGDWVTGYDGQPAVVSSATRSWFDGSLVILGDLATTPNHPVLTPAGWCPAGRLKAQPTVLAEPIREGMDPHVLGLIQAQPEIVGPVVDRVLVDVVYDLPRPESPVQQCLHHLPMLNDLTGRVPFPDGHYAVAPPVDETVALTLGRAGDPVQRGQSAGVAAVGTSPRSAAGSAAPAGVLDPELPPAFGAGAHRPGGAAHGEGALIGARSVRPLGNCRRDEELHLADPADAADHSMFTPTVTRWHTFDHGDRLDYSGWVYDITIPRCRSFFAEDVLVHNCPTQHVNVHELWRLYKRYSGRPPWPLMRTYSHYCRVVVDRGWVQAHPVPTSEESP